MVRVTPLQWRTDLENAAGRGEVLVLGRNVESSLEPFSMSCMTFNSEKGWYSLVMNRYLTEDDGFEPFAWAPPLVPSNLQEFYEACMSEKVTH